MMRSRYSGCLGADDGHEGRIGSAFLWYEFTAENSADEICFLDDSQWRFR
jgi:hypothetical protein